MNTLPTSSGIYQIKNKITGIIYIGSAVNIRKRSAKHLNALNHGNHHSLKLQRAYVKYGKDNFVFSVVELVGIPDLLSREQYWLDVLNVYVKGYNMSPTSRSSLGIKRSVEFKAKCRRRMLGTKRFLREEQKEVLRAQLKDCGLLNGSRKRPIAAYFGCVMMEFGTIKEAGEYLNIDPSSITGFLKGKLKSCGAGNHKKKNRSPIKFEYL